MIAATMICKGCRRDIDKAFNARDYSDLQVCQDCLDLANCCRDTCDDDDKGIAEGGAEAEVEMVSVDAEEGVYPPPNPEAEQDRGTRYQKGERDLIQGSRRVGERGVETGSHTGAGGTTHTTTRRLAEAWAEGVSRL